MRLSWRNNFQPIGAVDCLRRASAERQRGRCLQLGRCELIKDEHRSSRAPTTLRPGSATAANLEGYADPLRQVIVFDRIVALAGAGFERRTIEDRDAAAAIADDTALLQLLGEQGHGRTPHA